MPRSKRLEQEGQVHSRSFNVSASWMYPQQEQRLELGKKVSIATRLCEVIDVLLSFLIGQASPFKNQVIDFAHAAKGLSQENLLLGCGVEPIFIGPFERIHDTGCSLCQPS
jgi:hypothetical protein